MKNHKYIFCIEFDETSYTHIDGKINIHTNKKIEFFEDEFEFLKRKSKLLMAQCRSLGISNVKFYEGELKQIYFQW